MKIRIASLLEDSIVDGEGLRLVVFAQGCLHACPGCHNPSSHPLNEGYLIDEEEIIELLLSNPLLSGITLSGGEPFLQVDAFTSLCEAIAKVKQELDPEFTIMAYTGYTLEEMLHHGSSQKYLPLLKHIDILVDGRFIKSQKSLELKFRGSKNQRIIDLKQSMRKNEILPYFMA
ncbi:MAG: anaerobic ribonucleoside-triphosphate reductase activating protein [Clostridiaceae bacterium]